MIKDKIGKFQVIRFIAGGSFGDVWEVADTSGKHFAVKEISKERLVDSKMLDKLRSEAVVSAQLDHKNLVKCFSTMQSEKSFYLVFELCLGGNLDTFIKTKKKISLKVALDLISQLKDAYEYLYSKKIIHRDIKLENILLKSPDDLVLKLSDFGCSKIDTVGNTFVGTPKYMSFELLTKRLHHEEASYDYKADIWAIGLCAWELIFGYGSFPFRFTEMKVLAEEIRSFSGENLRFPAEPKLPSVCFDFFKRAIEFQSEKRMTAQELFNHPIFDLLEKKSEHIISIQPKLKNREHEGIFFFKERLAELKGIQVAIDGLKSLPTKKVKNDLKVKICAMQLILINKARIKTENALGSLNSKTNLLEVPNFDSIFDLPESKEIIEAFNAHSRAFSQQDKSLHDYFLQNCTDSAFREELEDSLYRGQTKNQQMFYKSSYMSLFTQLSSEFGEENRSEVDRTMKCVQVVLKGEVLQRKELFGISQD